MMMNSTGFYDMFSLMLGILACAIPVWGIFTRKKKQNTAGAVAASFSFCSFAVILQLFALEKQMVVGDYAAASDAVTALSSVAGVLFAYTLMLNLLLLYRKNTGNTATKWRSRRKRHTA